MKSLYLFILISGILSLPCLGQLVVTSSNDNNSQMCDNERVVLRLANSDKYTDISWSMVYYESNKPYSEKLETTLDSVVLEDRTPRLEIYLASAKEISTGNLVNAPQKIMLIKPAGTFDLLLHGTSTQAKERETICPKGSMKFEFNPDLITSQHAFEWNTEETTPFLEVHENGVYQLKVTPGGGQCPMFDEVTIKVLDPEVNFDKTYHEICESTELILDPKPLLTNVIDQLEYNWDNGKSYEPQLPVKESGKYELTTSYTTTQGVTCTASSEVKVNVHPNPEVDLGGESREICEGTELILNPEVTEKEALNQLTFSWNDGISTEAQLPVFNTGQYQLTTSYKPTPDLICSTSNQVEATIHPNPKVNLGQSTRNSCEGTELILDPQLVSEDNTFDQLTYNWNNGLSLEAQLPVKTTDLYKLATSYKANLELICSDTNEVNVTIHPNPIIKKLEDTTTSVFPISLTATIVTETPNDYNYMWYNENDKLIINESTLKVEEEGIYTVKLIDKETECLSKTHTTVSYVEPPTVPPVEPEPTKEIIFVPNVFSPLETDEDNQRLKIYGTDLSEDNFLFEVYNRWGEVVYSTNSLSEAQTMGWNGSKNNSGDYLSGGTYTYKVEGQYTNGSPFNLIGSATLLR